VQDLRVTLLRAAGRLGLRYDSEQVCTAWGLKFQDWYSCDDDEIEAISCCGCTYWLDQATRSCED
jgi:hypothetical protein